MSSFNYSIVCPNCHTSIDECADTKYGIYAECHECGYCKRTIEDQMSLKILNEVRENYNEYLRESEIEPLLEPLTELPKWNL